MDDDLEADQQMAEEENEDFSNQDKGLKSDDEDSMDSSESDDSDQNSIKDSNVAELQKTVKENPFHYDSHLALIKEINLLGDLDLLRKARENMAEIFPLTEELWIEWLTQESPLVVAPGHKEYVLSLFEKAIKDYMSVRVWLQYCQFLLDSIESSSGIEEVRKIYERAITAVGLHLTEGCSVWDSYREFEMTLLESLQAVEESSNDEKTQEQMQRVESIYRRQLSVPLLGMESTWQEYEDWTSEPIPDSVEKSYEKALSKLEQCLPFEDKLSTAPTTKLAEYQDYIEFELKDGDPARIQCLFERAIKDNCLVAELWQRYTNYLDHKLKVASISVQVHARAIRNCPWVSSLWNGYIKVLDRNHTSSSEIKEIFQKALGCGFSGADDYLQLWLTRCDCMKGRITCWKSDVDGIEELRKTFDDAVKYMDHYFGTDGDKSSLLRRYWAAVEAKHLGNLRKAQEIWDVIMKVHSKETHMWLEYTHFLRLHGDILSCRRAFQRAVQINIDSPEKLCEAYVHFERIEGDFGLLDTAMQRSKNQIDRIDVKRLKEAEIEAEKLKSNIEKEEKRKQTKLQKNRMNKKLGKQQKSKDFGESRKPKSWQKPSESVPHKKIEPKELKQALPSKDGESKSEEPPAKRPRVEVTSEKSNEEQGENEVKITEDQNIEGKFQSEAKMKQTVFLSNLLFAVDEEIIKSTFKEVGEINEVRIVRNIMGRSKGYAYLEFKDEGSVEKALLKDRELLNGRPMFVSPCLDKSKNQQHQAFRYSASLDKNTVFVTNLPFEAKREEIEELFKASGEVKEVRIVTNRAGKPKGYAYVEFVTEASAASAILNLDRHVVNDREINVALSKPPARRKGDKPFEQKPEFMPQAQQGSRGRARTQLAMVPRSIHTTSHKATNKQQDESKTMEKTSKTPAARMSNADFSKMFVK